MAVLYLGLIDLDLSSCLAVSPPPPLPPAPPSISGSCTQERTPRASLSRCESKNWQEERRQYRPSKVLRRMRTDYSKVFPVHKYKNLVLRTMIAVFFPKHRIQRLLFSEETDINRCFLKRCYNGKIKIRFCRKLEFSPVIKVYSNTNK